MQINFSLDQPPTECSTLYHKVVGWLLFLFAAAAPRVWVAVVLAAIYNLHLRGRWIRRTRVHRRRFLDGDYVSKSLLANKGSGYPERSYSLLMREIVGWDCAGHGKRT